jgi:NCAIR mutase (PurE)-related protein
MSNKLDNYVDEAISNIRDDRALASKLLIQLMNDIAADSTKHERNGLVAAKYLETLQRSNEQLVKISSLLQKDNANAGLTAMDKENIFDLIKESREDG